MKETHFDEAKKYIEESLAREIEAGTKDGIVTVEQINEIKKMRIGIENSDLNELQKTELINALYDTVEGLEITEGSKKTIIDRVFYNKEEVLEKGERELEPKSKLESKLESESEIDDR